MLTVPAGSLSSAHRRRAIERVIRHPVIRHLLIRHPVIRHHLPLVRPFDPVTTAVAGKPGV
jgi:hypothetical protein